MFQYVNEGSLEQSIQNPDKELAWPLRMQLAADTAKGVAYLHQRGIMHRDLTSKVRTVFGSRFKVII